MSTYEELSLIISIALLVVAILNYTHKKQPSCPDKADDYFLQFLSCAGAGEVQSPSGYPGKYIFLRICSGDFGSVGYISYNVKAPVLLRGLSCAGKLHCPNVIHAKVFCSITLYVGMPQKSILYTIIIYQYIIRRFFYLLYLNFHRLILYLQKHRNNAKVLLFVFC